MEKNSELPFSERVDTAVPTIRIELVFLFLRYLSKYSPWRVPLCRIQYVDRALELLTVTWESLKVLYLGDSANVLKSTVFSAGMSRYDDI